MAQQSSAHRLGVWILALAAGAALISIFCRRCDHPSTTVQVERDTVWVREYLRDTVRLVATRRMVRTDTVWVHAVAAGDSVLAAVALPFERRTYATENYRAIVTGYKPELESIELFPKVKVITQTRTVTTTRPPRWQAGLVAGAGGGMGLAIGEGRSSALAGTAAGPVGNNGSAGTGGAPASILMVQTARVAYIDCFVGLRVRRNWGAFSLEGTLGYDLPGRGLCGEIRAGIDLIRK